MLLQSGGSMSQSGSMSQPGLQMPSQQVMMQAGAQMQFQPQPLQLPQAGMPWQPQMQPQFMGQGGAMSQQSSGVFRTPDGRMVTFSSMPSQQPMPVQGE